jgi:hypothetical protein
MPLRSPQVNNSGGPLSKTNQGEPMRLTLETVHQTGQLEKLKWAAFHALCAGRADDSTVAHAAGYIDPVTCPQGNTLFRFGKNYLKGALNTE